MSSSDSRTIRIGTRASKLALWQAEYVKSIMVANNPDLQFEIVSMTTTGDNNLTSPLSQFENKGVFTKELDSALLQGDVDVVVHCMKDLATELPRGIRFCAVMERESPDDCVILHPKHLEGYKAFKIAHDEELKNNPNLPKISAALSYLPSGAIIGTSALRRQAILARYHPTLVCKDVRGNVLTRIEKLNNGDYDALILAKVGLERLGLHDVINDVLDSEHYLNAVGQASLAIVCRTSDDGIKDLFMSNLHNIPAAITCTIERGMLYQLQGGCKVPIAVNSKYYIVSNNFANKHLTMIETYRNVTTSIMANELESPHKQSPSISSSTTTLSSTTTPSSPSTIPSSPTEQQQPEPIETDLIPPHLYTNITSLLPSTKTDLRDVILEQNRLVHSLDSDYEDEDDEYDNFRNSTSFTSKQPTTLQSQVFEKLTSVTESEDEPISPSINIVGDTPSSPTTTQAPLLTTPTKSSSTTSSSSTIQPLAPLNLTSNDWDDIQPRERKFSTPLTPRTQAQTWSLLVITRAAVMSMNGQNYIETIRADHFPLYLKSQFVNPISSKAWALGKDLGKDLVLLGADTILSQIRTDAERIEAEIRRSQL